VGGHDFMGQVTIGGGVIDLLPAGQERVETLQLKDTTSGQLHVRLTKFVTPQDELYPPSPSNRASVAAPRALLDLPRGNVPSPNSSLSPRFKAPFSPYDSITSSMGGSITMVSAGFRSMASSVFRLSQSGPVDAAARPDDLQASQVRRLEVELAAKEEQLQQMKHQHAAVLMQMKRDQSALLGKVTELEEALSEL